MVKRIGDDVPRRPTLDEVKRVEVAEPPKPEPMQLRKPLRRALKGDGITREKPVLPSALTPDVAPLPKGGTGPKSSENLGPDDRPISKPRGPKSSETLGPDDRPISTPRPALPGRNRLTKGDGMTSKKARLPGVGEGGAVPVPVKGNPGLLDDLKRQMLGQGGPAPRRDGRGVQPQPRKPALLQRPPRPASWWKLAQQRKEPALNTIQTQQSFQGPQIPPELVGVSADKFYAAYQAALKKGEGWATELQAFGKSELARVEREARFGPGVVPDKCGTNGSATVDNARDVAGSHLRFCRAAGEPWAIALSEDGRRSTFSSLIEQLKQGRIPEEDFAPRYQQAVVEGDPQALALQEQASDHVQEIASQVQAATAYAPAPVVDTAVADQVGEAAEAGEPWAVAAQSDQAAQIPSDLLPVTPDNAPAFREAYRKGLENGDPWAVELQKFSADKLAALDAQIDRARATAKVTDDGVFDQMRTDALEGAKQAGEPWAYAALADAAPPTPAPTAKGEVSLPTEWPTPLPADRVDEFKAAFKEALKSDEPWARALIEQGQQKMAELEEKFEGLPGADDVEGKGGPRTEQRVAGQVSRAEKAGEPWAVALKAEGELRLEQAEQKKIDQATNTKFRAKAPEVGVGDPKDHNKVRNQVDADGSMKVPAQKEAFVGEYVRTNPVVQDLRLGGLANVYNPLYQQHLAGAVDAAGRGEAPPQGKGFLAMTDHGFAYCYDPSKSPEHNAKIAELSLLSGMSFEQCRDARVGVVKHNDGKFEDALEVFKNFDPTKAGEVKIALDDSGKGKVEIVLKSDGNGGVTSEHSKQPSTWTKIGRAVAQYGLPVAALVCAVVPGLQGVAAICVSTASAVKSVVEGIKNKDWLGAVLGAVGAVGGVLQIAGKVAGGATSALATTGSRISDAAKALEGVRGVISGIKDKSLSGTLLAVANVAGGLAGVVPDAKGLSTALTSISEQAKKFGQLAAFGEKGLAALKNGDYLGAFVEAVKLGTTAGKNWLGLDPKVADKLLQGADVMQSVNTAVKNKDWTTAVSELLKGVQQVTGSDNKLLDAGATLAGLAQSLAHSDPMGAAKLAMEFVGKLTTGKADAQKKLDDPNTPAAEKTGLAKLLEGIDKQLGFFGKFENVVSGIGEVVKAVKAKDPAAILEAASGVVADLTKNGKISAAHDIIAAARVAYQAAKSGDQIAAMQAAVKLGQAIGAAVDSLHSDKKEPGTVPDPKEAITGALPPDQAAQAEGYRVKVGDTLPAIAKTLLGDENRWPELYAYNRNALGDDPANLLGGVKLEVPPEGFAITAEERAAIIEQAKGQLPAGPPAPGAPVAPPGEYTARPGDSLSAIAKRLLGSASKWPELYEYNKDVIGENPNGLGVGDTLKLPPADFTISDARRKEIIALAQGASGVSSTPKPDADVKIAQNQLNTWLGYFKEDLAGQGLPTKLTESGVMDAATTQVLQAFQSSYGLPATGKLDSATAKKLQEMELSIQVGTRGDKPTQALLDRGQKLLDENLDELLRLTTLGQGILVPSANTAAQNALDAAKNLQSLLKDPRASGDEIERAMTKFRMWNDTVQKNLEGDLGTLVDLGRVVRDTCGLIVTVGSGGTTSATVTALGATLKALTNLGETGSFKSALLGGLTVALPAGLGKATATTVAGNMAKEVASALASGVDKYAKERDAAIAAGTWKAGDSQKLWDKILLETLKNAPMMGVKAALSTLKANEVIDPSTLQKVFVSALNAGWKALPVPK